MHDAYAVLRIRDYRLFITVRFFTTIAFQMQGLIVAWQVYELTRDPLQLGLIGLAEALPFIAVALYAGHVADLYNRKRVILLFVLLFFLGTMILLAFTTGPQLCMHSSEYCPFILWLLFPAYPEPSSTLP